MTSENVKVLSTKYKVSNETKSGRQFNIVADVTMNDGVATTFENGSISKVENGEYLGSFYKAPNNYSQNLNSDWAFENRDAIMQELSSFMNDCNSINI